MPFPDDPWDVLAACGIAGPRQALAQDAAAAVRLAAEIGYPVVLKVSSDRIAHRSEIGGVAVGLRTRRGGGTRLRRRSGIARAPSWKDEQPDGVLVQEQVEGGVELILGVEVDPQFGPFVLVGPRRSLRRAPARRRAAACSRRRDGGTRDARRAARAPRSCAATAARRQSTRRRGPSGERALAIRRRARLRARGNRRQPADRPASGAGRARRRRARRPPRRRRSARDSRADRLSRDGGRTPARAGRGPRHPRRRRTCRASTTCRARGASATGSPPAP